MPEIVCILNIERSKPPALRYLTINKYGNIALFKIFCFQIQNIIMHSGNNFSSLHNKTFEILGHLCKKNQKPPLLICTRESDPDSGL